MEGNWTLTRQDLNRRPVESVTGEGTREEIEAVLGKYGIHAGRIELWGSGRPLREFLWSEDMADASVHVLELTRRVQRKSGTVILTWAREWRCP